MHVKQPLHKYIVGAGLIASIGLVMPHSWAQNANGPELTVDVAADRHSISPEIYGINDFGASPDQVQALHPTVYRWGGDHTTRYNWEVDGTNSGDDWFFMAGGQEHPTPGKAVDEVVQKAKGVGGRAVVTIPVIDYINKATQQDSSFPVSLYGPQQKTNPYTHPIVDGKPTDAGNGRKPDGTPIVLDQAGILRVHVPNTPAHQQAWIKHLLGRFGTAANGGVSIYEMDNEPGGWANTHRDIHPTAPDYKEITAKTISYAAAVKEADPTAQVDGPGDFGWAIYNSNADKNGGLGNAEYYLQQMRQYEQQHGKRILDYFDEHYYPVAQDGQNDATRLESTRSLWDTTYIEKNWIGKWGGAINLIPRMRGWVDKNYPGTKTSITEYNWGGMDTLNGALTQADVLGIFGRERLDMATMWGPPKADQPAAYAFRIYRNYDGQGGQYGNTWVHSTSADQGRLAIYGAQRQQDGALTLMIINKTANDLTSNLHLSHFTAAGQAQVYRYSGANLKAIVPQPSQALTATGFTGTFPANSISLVVIHAAKP